MIHENTYLKEQCTELQEKLVKLEYHSRRNNLQFDGFAEKEGETDRDCYNKVRRAIANCYDDEVDPDNADNIIESAFEKAGKVVINRIHRYGVADSRGKRNRPIIVNFQCYLDRDLIMSNKKEHA